MHGFCLRLVPHSPPPITFALARALKHPVISLKNLAPIPAALISHRAIAIWTYATYTPTLSLSIKALDSQFPLIMDKLTDIAAMTLQDYLKKNSQIQRMEVALFKASPRVIRLKCIGYIPLAPFSQVKDWALASAPLVRTPN